MFRARPVAEVPLARIRPHPRHESFPERALALLVLSAPPVDLSIPSLGPCQIPSPLRHIGSSEAPFRSEVDRIYFRSHTRDVDTDGMILSFVPMAMGSSRRSGVGDRGGWGRQNVKPFCYRDAALLP
jgi:hypothetical protein